MVAEAALRRSTRPWHVDLLRLLREGTTKVEDLAEALAVSPSTVRHDLGRLDVAGQVAGPTAATARCRRTRSPSSSAAAPR